MQPVTPMPRRPRKPGTRKPVVFIGLAALVVIAAVIITLLITSANNSQPFPNRSAMIPDAQMRTLDTPQAMRYDLGTAEAAQAYFDRLMASKYIGLQGSVSEGPQSDGDGWSIREETADGDALTAVFDKQGLIASLSVSIGQSGEMKTTRTPYELGNGDESLFTYIRAFTYEYLPDVAVVSGVIKSDQYTDEGRFITVLADSQEASQAYEFVVQIDPESRIVGFRILVDPSQAYIRTSRMAQPEDDAGEPEDPDKQPEPVSSNTAVQRARDALIDQLGFSAEEVANFVLVDVSWYGDEVDVPSAVDSDAYFVVSFRLPESDETIYSDYAVFIDEETGEILRILDPSNISNG